MRYTLAEAAEATGSTRSSILRAIEAGRITATKDLFGEWQVERSELQRLDAPSGKDITTGNSRSGYPASDVPTLEGEIEALVSATGDGLRQPDDAPPPSDPYQATHHAPHRLFAELDRANLWSPASPNPGAFEAVAPIMPLEQQELPLIAGPSALSSPATGDTPLPLEQIRISGAEAASAWDGEIRIGNGDRVLRPTSFGAQRTRLALIGAGLVAALGLGWMGAWSSHRIAAGTQSGAPVQKPDSPARSAGSEESVRVNALAKSREASPPGQTVRKIGLPPATKPVRSSDDAHTAAKPAASSTKPGSSAPAQNTSVLAPPAPAQQQAKLDPKRAPVPETKPTTIEGWTVREVAGNAAVLEGPNGVFRARAGDTVPGVGRINSIVRWGGRWIVATSRGLISTQ